MGRLACYQSAGCVLPENKSNFPTMNSFDSEQQHIFVETNNIRLHCVSQGEGELVLLLHGFQSFGTLGVIKSLL